FTSNQGDALDAPAARFAGLYAYAPAISDRLEAHRMSSIGTILSNATSGLLAAQTGITTVSNNVANANTPGYVRQQVNQTSLVNLGAGAGVDVKGVTRAVNRYLENASLAAGSTAGSAGALSDLLDQAQGLFGDPTSDSNYFSTLDTAETSFGALS